MTIARQFRRGVPTVALLALLVAAGAGCREAADPAAPAPPVSTVPAAVVLPLAEQQTSYRFTVELAVIDPGSGNATVELWSAWEDNGPALLGSYAPGPVTVVVDTLGRHDFYAVAVDAAGNRQATPAAPQASTVVPPRVVIIDRRGEHFDITNALLRYTLRLDGWDHGLGRTAIPPINFPEYMSPGDPNYPDANSVTEILAIDYDGIRKAWKIGDITDREVVNDRTPGVEFAATY